MKARKVKGLRPEAPLAPNAARIAEVRLAELRGFADAALERGEVDAQHDMRIAAKRLRYVLEVTEDCFGEAGPRARRAAKELQEILGDLHDCDVMLPRVRRHAESLAAADARAVLAQAGAARELPPALAAGAPGAERQRGLAVLGVHLTARRALLFDRFTELWAEQEAGGVWRALERSAAEARGRAS